MLGGRGQKKEPLAGGMASGSGRRMRDPSPRLEIPFDMALQSVGPTVPAAGLMPVGSESTQKSCGRLDLAMRRT